MAKPDVLVMGPYPAWDMEPLHSDYNLHCLWEASDRDQMIHNVGLDIRAIATRGELGAGRELIDRLPRLEMIACYGVGTDAIDLVAARARNIKVSNTPDVLTKDVADMALGLILAALRQIPQADRYVRSGRWAEQNMHLVTSLTGKRVGILGFGRIGRMVAQRAAAFDCKVAYSDMVAVPDAPYDYYDHAVALAEQSDVLVVTVSGGKPTENIVNEAVLKALGPHGYLVNVSRGSTVDERALIKALESGAIAGAGLDVFWNEPRIDPRLLTFENVILQPHHSSGTVETRQAMGRLVRENLAAHFAGRPLLTPVP